MPLSRPDSSAYIWLLPTVWPLVAVRLKKNLPLLAVLRSKRASSWLFLRTDSMPLMHEPLAEYPSLLRITWPLPALRSNWNSPLARLLISNLPDMPAPWNLWMKTGFCRRASEGLVIRQSAQRLLRGARSEEHTSELQQLLRN